MGGMGVRLDILTAALAEWFPNRGRAGLVGEDDADAAIVLVSNANPGRCVIAPAGYYT
jgi:hypothetical protein